MNEDFTLYFGSVAEALVVFAVFIISGVALTTGYTVVKKTNNAVSVIQIDLPHWDSFATWLVITVEVILTFHMIKAIFWPNWVTLTAAGAIALVQILLNCIIHRDIKAAYLPLRNEDF